MTNEATTSRTRYLERFIREDLENRMVLLGGPRQVGKTTLARQCARESSASRHVNWDNRSQRLGLLRGDWPADTDFLILDELHKYAKWKTLVKGFWDTRPPGRRILVTGSSRLDLYRRGGDSLLGRYRYYRLHPFTAAELSGRFVDATGWSRHPPAVPTGEEEIELGPLLRFGGFPEPVLSGRERTWRRWQKERFERVFREDIRDVESVRALSQVELLGQLVPSKVGSPLSIRSLALDLEASPRSVQAWMELLARNYYVFRIPPFHRRLSRALRKESKYYLWDWSEVAEAGPRFENMVASHLLKFCHLAEDVAGLSVGLHYVRDAQKHEVDFLIVWDGKPWLLVETKLQVGGGYTALSYFGDRLGISHRYLVVEQAGVDFADRGSGVRVLSAGRFLGGLA
jgi:uncharacterized protein